MQVFFFYCLLFNVGGFAVVLGSGVVLKQDLKINK